MKFEDLTMLFSDIDDLEVISDTTRLRKLSQDFNWYSPILKEKIGDKSADIVLRPYTQESIVNSMRIIYNNNLELTVRGSGTGNYGQLVPLNGGVLIDMSRFTGIKRISDTEVTVKSGTKIIDIETFCHESKNKEVRMFPSTYRSASIGGFFCGGSGGIGSLIYGQLAEENNINSISICSLESQPKLINLNNKELSSINHAYGTNGVVVDITLPLENRENWIEYVFAFDEIDKAMSFCDYICVNFQKNIRLLTLLDKPISNFIAINENSTKGKILVVLMSKYSDINRVLKLKDKHNGTTILKQNHDDVRIKGKTVIEFTWNHTTLHAIKANKNITYLQSSYGSISEYRDRIASLKRQLGSEYIIHLEYVMSNNNIVVNGLPLIIFKSELRLYEIIKIHTELGVSIADPHIYTINARGNINYENILTAKNKFDPKFLMNTKKLDPEMVTPKERNN